MWLLMIDPALASHFDRFPRKANMTVFTLRSVRAIMLVIFFMAADTAGRFSHLLVCRCSVAIDAFEFLVLPLQLEVGLVMIKVPIFPVAGVVASFATFAKCAFMHVLFFMA